jgi:hypothetical protein
MSNSHAELDELADRVEAGAAEGSLSSERAVQLRALEPLLEVLGWDVRGPAVVPAATIGELEVDYLLTVDEVPAILVATAAPSGELQTDGIARIDAGIADSRATRGIATDGSTVVLLVEHDGEVHRRSVPFAELPEHAEALGQFHRTVVARTTAVERADRDAAARRLVENRTEVVESITETIVAVADEPVDDEVAAAADRTIDALVETFRSEDAGDGERDRSDLEDSEDGSERVADAARSEPSVPDPESTPGASGTGSPRSGDGSVGSSSATDGRSDAAEESAESRTSDGEEYVVRFFGGSSSVGAVGTETPRGTTVGTVRYLLENHGLAASITLPWRYDEGTVVLAEVPGGDGWTTLSNASGSSISVRPIDDPETARRVIDDLAETAGLRAMFQGDW